ncbi:hypothetical protein L596_024559 [Steinernema carpocapsae]|uniref:C2H2-type domain-containing protein n=1 Tax=Steinernema carpocapsae TaxID=34508 RepID=A0A4V5ZZR7_STECR|nr:hypothetical protein L596_024559 [Steinernema carpocapsae]
MDSNSSMEALETLISERLKSENSKPNNEAFSDERSQDFEEDEICDLYPIPKIEFKEAAPEEEIDQSRNERVWRSENPHLMDKSEPLKPDDEAAKLKLESGIALNPMPGSYFQTFDRMYEFKLPMLSIVPHCHLAQPSDTTMNSPCPNSTMELLDALIYQRLKHGTPSKMHKFFTLERSLELERVMISYIDSIRKSQVCETEFRKGPDAMHARFCQINDLKKSADFAVFQHFYARQDFDAIEALFEGETLQKFCEMAQRIKVPRIERMLANYRIKAGKRKRRAIAYSLTFKCRICKHQIKGSQKNRMAHVGVHENIPVPCILKSCDKILSTFNSLESHIYYYHNLRISKLNAAQYHQLHAARRKYNRRAAVFEDKYFPPEAFVQFNDRVAPHLHKLEARKCQECGKIVGNPKSRRSHAGVHLGWTTKCVVESCEKIFPCALEIAGHLHAKHKKKLVDLNASELYAYRKARMEFQELIKEEFSKYFPMNAQSEEIGG